MNPRRAAPTNHNRNEQLRMRAEGDHAGWIRDLRTSATPTNPEELQVLTSGGREEDVRLGRQGVAGNGGEAMECGGKSTAFIGERARGVRARLTQAGPAHLARPRIL